MQNHILTRLPDQCHILVLSDKQPVSTTPIHSLRSVILYNTVTPNYVLDRPRMERLFRIAKNMFCLIILLEIDLNGLETPAKFVHVHYGTLRFSKNKLSPFNFIHM